MIVHVRFIGPSAANAKFELVINLTTARACRRGDRIECNQLHCICRLLAAGSTGRRNTGVKFLCRGFKSQGLAWPLIELAGQSGHMHARERWQRLTLLRATLSGLGSVTPPAQD